MAVFTWRAQRNEKARARLMRNLPEVFPAAVLVHALSRPFLPATPRRAVDSYWRYHPVRADKLARALATLSCAPEGWVWQVESRNRGHWSVFRRPNPVWRTGLYEGPGHCCVCRQPIFRFGWHLPLGATGAQIKTLHGTVVTSRLGTYGLRQAIMSGT